MAAMLDPPYNPQINPLLTDLYQLTMAYAYWKTGCVNDDAVFDAFFRKSPFDGEFTIFCGLEDLLRFVAHFKFTEQQINYVKTLLPDAEETFFDWLRSVDCSKVRIVSQREGSVVFPRVPLVRVEGPLGVVQLLETTLLNCINFSSLVATNAARMRLAVGPSKRLLEFGLRRAQGPDGGMTASRYAYIGGFDGTSNVLAGMQYGMPVRGTHAHAFVQSYTKLDSLKNKMIKKPDGTEVDFVKIVAEERDRLKYHNTNEGELAAFTAYAISFPTGLLALVDTYDTVESGVRNFLVVVFALHRVGYRAVGVRLDSGDLAYLSKIIRKMFEQSAESNRLPWVRDLTIVASNDINEDTLQALNQQGHEIDVFGIGTHLVTCQKQPALGCVYKLVELDGVARIKISQDVNKVSIPCRKAAYRLYGKDGHPLVDLMMREIDTPPQAGSKVMCCHPFQEQKRVYVVPQKVEPLTVEVWNGKMLIDLPSIEDVKAYTAAQLASLREDHKRFLNPTPYKISVSEELYQYIHQLWSDSIPIPELH
eukprot:TRINITY_DN2502_c1_g1::TRINITY_DN2502_c1_g1_i1::g.19330::m.19330 TRINITY_DN2502_c1_g1::TRINITY_DN2502_c1_g1_i1::g.19330  ORF type:complete len:535 (-),score=154.22,sp/Q55G10/PNCB_DICDI/56.18/0.0,NAPRTase/PF04095.11/3.9e-29,QRPTase_N/PF02749.11/0.14 TRINITY_DN2502_c1_g1_i1:310-1914(-)